MDQKIKQQWIDALRSGNYSQTRQRLHDKHGYCGLGVLCDLHSKATGNSWEPLNTKNWDDNLCMAPLEEEIERGTKEYYNSISHLPDAVYEWSGLPRAAYGQLVANSFIYLNDVLKCSFDEIATYIEGHF